MLKLSCGATYLRPEASAAQKLCRLRCSRLSQGDGSSHGLHQGSSKGQAQTSTIGLGVMAMLLQPHKTLKHLLTRLGMQSPDQRLASSSSMAS